MDGKSKYIILSCLRYHLSIEGIPKGYLFCQNGRFYVRDDKVVQTYLTSETLKMTGVKTGRIKVDDKIEKKPEICEKKKNNNNTDSSKSSLHHLDINAFRFTASRFYERR